MHISAKILLGSVLFFVPAPLIAADTDPFLGTWLLSDAATESNNCTGQTRQYYQGPGTGIQEIFFTPISDLLSHVTESGLETGNPSSTLEFFPLSVPGSLGASGGTFSTTYTKPNGWVYTLTVTFSNIEQTTLYTKAHITYDFTNISPGTNYIPDYFIYDNIPCSTHMEWEGTHFFVPELPVPPAPAVSVKAKLSDGKLICTVLSGTSVASGVSVVADRGRGKPIQFTSYGTKVTNAKGKATFGAKTSKYKKFRCRSQGATSRVVKP